MLAERESILVKPMFGQTGVFVNGNPSAGTFGKQTFVRLSEEETVVLLKEKGATNFAPTEKVDAQLYRDADGMDEGRAPRKRMSQVLRLGQQDARQAGS